MKKSSTQQTILIVVSILCGIIWIGQSIQGGKELDDTPKELDAGRTSTAADDSDVSPKKSGSSDTRQIPYTYGYWHSSEWKPCPNNSYENGKLTPYENPDYAFIDVLFAGDDCKPVVDPGKTLSYLNRVMIAHVTPLPPKQQHDYMVHVEDLSYSLLGKEKALLVLDSVKIEVALSEKGPALQATESDYKGYDSYTIYYDGVIPASHPPLYERVTFDVMVNGQRRTIKKQYKLDYVPKYSTMPPEAAFKPSFLP